MTESQYSYVRRIVWRALATGPGVATLEYVDGGQDHRKMSQYQARFLAESIDLVALHEGHDLQEWIRR